MLQESGRPFAWLWLLLLYHNMVLLLVLVVLICVHSMLLSVFVLYMFFRSRLTGKKCYARVLSRIFDNILFRLTVHSVCCIYDVCVDWWSDSRCAVHMTCIDWWQYIVRSEHIYITDVWGNLNEKWWWRSSPSSFYWPFCSIIIRRLYVCYML